MENFWSGTSTSNSSKKTSRIFHWEPVIRLASLFCDTDRFVPTTTKFFNSQSKLFACNSKSCSMLNNYIEYMSWWQVNLRKQVVSAYPCSHFGYERHDHRSLRIAITTVEVVNTWVALLQCVIDVVAWPLWIKPKPNIPILFHTLPVRDFCVGSVKIF